MAIKINKGIAKLVEEAEAVITTISTEEAIRRQKGEDENTMFIDIRDIRELERDGMVPGAMHVPRGMIEFWFDPDSPYHREIYGDKDKTYVLFCNGNPRSALSAKALKDMGITNVAQLSGGMPAWREAGGPTVEKSRE